MTASTASVRLPFLTKLIYGLGDWGNTTTSTINRAKHEEHLTALAQRINKRLPWK
jgi:hypothetical protein